MTRPVEISFDDLLGFPQNGTELWVQPAVHQRVAETLPYQIGEPLRTSPDTERVVVIGGGTLLDAAKAWRADSSPKTSLIAVPSIWGSGAEVSPVVVLNVDQSKSIRMSESFLPDQVAYWPELASSLSDRLARAACGDCWAHALEGFLSPLADDALRDEIASLLRRMLETPLGRSPAWFKLSADACRAQTRSSVGLVHGIAHTLEAQLRARFPSYGWGHALLCSVFLLPVMAFNRQLDGKSDRLLAERGINVEGILRVANELHDASAFQMALPFLRGNWQNILRDRSTRTNTRLVRLADLEFFVQWSGG